MGARDKINAISSNVKVNKRKSVHIRGYKLPINLQNFMQKDSAEAKISSKVVGGVTFLTDPVYFIIHHLTFELFADDIRKHVLFEFVVNSNQVSLRVQSLTAQCSD